MRFSPIALISLLATSAIAKGVVTGKISNTNSGQSIHFGEIDTQVIKTLPIHSPKDIIEIDLKNSDIKNKQPEQIMISLSDNLKPSIVTHFVPTVKDDTIKLKIRASSIPELLKTKESLALSLIIGDSSGDSNLIKRLGELIPSQEFKLSSNYKSKPKFGVQPEIHHIFKEDEKTINPIIPTIFIGFATFLFLALLGSWFGFIGANNLFFKTFNRTSIGQISHNILFFSSLIGFEFNFVKYYLGQSIFTTLFYGFVLSFPCYYFGLSVLTYLGKNRLNSTKIKKSKTSSKN
ncbi:uncharacterized protein KGF55_000558 [Candida pseudojiufengensis]|uniref:uncharacterized protein n=1 Tax=Candida pseudojiufengensis TaxID=497109 RepID=UPI002224D14F|nr:uncharacterized protein KGF55_000558 [Candida pseudojiufengensis]KAI5966249.1 hypothetical protein KGF55_000558 [Candida pseudojiufengensis]